MKKRKSFPLVCKDLYTFEVYYIFYFPTELCRTSHLIHSVEGNEKKFKRIKFKPNVTRLVIIKRRKKRKEE